jgi:hypothetical protein
VIVSHFPSGRWPILEAVSNPRQDQGQLPPSLRATRFLKTRSVDPSLATAALIAWEWLQREEHLFGAFEAAHYRPKERPNSVLIVHPKTGEEAWSPLHDERVSSPDTWVTELSPLSQAAHEASGFFLS